MSFTIWIEQLGMKLLLWLLGFIDSVFAVFRAVAGMDSVTTPTSGTDGETLSSYFLNLDGVQWAFWVIIIASVAICGVCTIVAVVKNIVGKNVESKSHVRTIGQSLSTIFITLFMATILVVGVTCADKLLGAIDKEINHGNTAPISHKIIDTSVSGGYDLDIDNVQGFNRYDEDGNCIYKAYLYEMEYEDPETRKRPKRYTEIPGYEHCIVYLQEDGNRFIKPSDIYNPRLDKDGNAMFDEDGVPVYDLDFGQLTLIRSEGNGWLFNKFKNEYYSIDYLPDSMFDASVYKILGDYDWTIVPIPTGWEKNGMIDPEAFNYFIAYLCAIVLLVALIGATFGLVKRLFDIVILFITLPGIVATIPLDDGAKFKLWRETVISKVFLAFGTIIAVNVFTIVAPQIWGINLSTSGMYVNMLLKAVLICGGALTISGGQLLFARLLGTSAEESREMGQSARTLMGGAMTGLGITKAAGRGLFGYRNASGQRVGGLIKGGAGVAAAVAGGVVNALGGAIAGQAYKSSAVGRGVSKTQQALKNFGGSSGWFGKDKTTGGNTLGGAIASSAGKLGGKIAGSGVAQKTGFNKGIMGAIESPIDRKHAIDRDNARSMLALGNAQIESAYSAAAAAEAAKLKALPRDDFGGHEVLPGFESTPSTLPALSNKRDDK